MSVHSGLLVSFNSSGSWFKCKLAWLPICIRGLVSLARCVCMLLKVLVAWRHSYQNLHDHQFVSQCRKTQQDTFSSWILVMKDSLPDINRLFACDTAQLWRNLHLSYWKERLSRHPPSLSATKMEGHLPLDFGSSFCQHSKMMMLFPTVQNLNHTKDVDRLHKLDVYKPNLLVHPS